MEKWLDVFKGVIPKDNYIIKLVAGSETGMIVYLHGWHADVEINFHWAEAVRMIEYRSVGECESVAEEILAEEGFPNTIYEIVDGDWGKDFQKMQGGMNDVYPFRQYVLETVLYRLDILAEADREPEIKVTLIEADAEHSTQTTEDES